ncbi:MAG: hypothetical protein CYPHOPRED_003773 [Cyphobasidiales sp. Tagirdzhanova-0007]|nr:MAG: hypothetical protein CYPHOPRED_003773 [Cyphobasidiales sp. Tagirdzhanova-0007]
MRATAALTLLAFASSPVLGAPASPIPASDISAFAAAPLTHSLPNSPDLGSADIASFASLKLVDLDQDAPRQVKDTQHKNAKNLEKGMKYDELAKHKQKQLEALQTKPGNGDHPNIRFKISAQGQKHNDSEYEKWLKVQKVGKGVAPKESKQLAGSSHMKEPHGGESLQQPSIDHITRHSRTHGDRNASEHLGGGMQKSSKLPTTTSNAAKLASTRLRDSKRDVHVATERLPLNGTYELKHLPHHSEQQDSG